MATHAVEQRPEAEIEPDDRMRFAFAVVLGTLAAAGCFGLMIGGLFGLFLGPIIAIIEGLPIFLATLLTAWSRFISRLYPISAILCGTATGFLSSSSISSRGALEPAVILASFLGGTGGAIACLIFIRNSSGGRRIKQAFNAPGAHSRFGQIVLHLGIVALLGFTLFRAAEKYVADPTKAEQDQIRRNSRLRD